jgi:hypothetical protein
VIFCKNPQFHVNFKKSSKFPGFSGEGVPFRRHAKTAVIPMVFHRFWSPFPAPDPPKPQLFEFLQESAINHQKSVNLAKFPVF